MRLKAFLKIGCAGLGAGFLILAAYIVVLIHEHQGAIGKLSNYNLAWISGQASVELGRLSQRATAFAAGHIADPDEVQLRFDILVNRLNLLKTGEFKEFVDLDRERVETVAALERVIGELEPMMDHLTPEQARRVVHALEPLDPKILKMTSDAYAFGTDKLMASQQRLSALQGVFLKMVVAVIACGLGMIIFLAVQNNWISTAHDKVQVLARDLGLTAEDLGAAKSALEGLNQELSLRNERFDAALRNMVNGLIMVDAAQNLIVCNDRFREMTGVDPKLLPTGLNLFELRDSRNDRAAEVIRLHDAVRLSMEGVEQLRFMHDCESGRSLHISCQRLPEGGWIATCDDVTSRRRAEAKIQYLAHHDVLTGLPNRARLEEWLGELAEAASRRDAAFALLSIDLDRFKHVNDTLGHQIGDRVLCDLGKRIAGCLPAGAMAARFGGDEFTVLLPDCAGSEAAAGVAQDIVRALSEPVTVSGNEIVLGGSIGIAMSPQDGTSAEQLLRNADLALYRAKFDGRGQVSFFDLEMDTSVQARQALEMDLRRALGNGEFDIFYQPIVAAGDKESVIGYEALLRWLHPSKGLVSPAEFIPIAEEIGLIGVIGDWVLRTACTEAMLWPLSAMLSVNVSPAQLRNPEFASSVVFSLAASGLPPDRLTLEITESALLEENAHLRRTLRQLQGLGVKIALDDFGTGYSSLSYLRQYQFDKVKVDKSFVHEITTSTDAAAIVDLIIGLARTLNMTITAEGVETQEQCDLLAGLGCHEMQGYFFGRPVSHEAVIRDLSVLGSKAA